MLAWIIMIPQERWNIRRREGTLYAGHLVVVELHRVHGRAAVLVVLRIRPED